MVFVGGWAGGRGGLIWLGCVLLAWRRAFKYVWNAGLVALCGTELERGVSGVVDVGDGIAEACWVLEGVL